MLLIDHVVIFVEHLTDAAAAFSNIGFSVSERGYHATFSTENHLISFDNGYLELLGVGQPCAQNELFRDRIAQGIGLAGLALATNDLQRSHSEAAQNGIDLADILSFSRPVVVAGEYRTASFKTSFVEPISRQRPLTFFCEHLTRHLIWNQGATVHPNGASGIASAHYRCADPTEFGRVLTMLTGTGMETDGNRTRVGTGAQYVALSAQGIPQLTITVALLPTPRTIAEAGFGVAKQLHNAVVLHHPSLGMMSLKLIERPR